MSEINKDLPIIGNSKDSYGIIYHISFDNIQYGTLAKHVEAKPSPRPMEETYEFRSSEGFLNVFISWRAKEKIKTTALIRIYDLSSRLLIESKPTKIDLKPGKEAPSYTWWKADISSLKPGFYRVDALVDSSPMGGRSLRSVTEAKPRRPSPPIGR